MLHSLQRQLRRHRRQVIVLCVVLGLAGAGVAAYAAVEVGQHDHGMRDTVAMCLTVGGCVAVAGIAILRVAPASNGPTTASPGLSPTARPSSVPAGALFLVRAGPPPGRAVLRL